MNTNHIHWSQAAIIDLFRQASSARLRAAGDVWNSGGPLTVFQGRSADHDGAGLSWTLDVELARWFARRYSDPVIWSGVVDEADVLAYVNRKEEQEIIALPERVLEQHRVE